ncbi:MAG: MBL fold metallo-hydrolase [Candidatus Taylorbacteria bacterium]|nr:MBL fold metallo-hydrolase [Candidatus Taylorbacteria bacterium]
MNISKLYHTLTNQISDKVRHLFLASFIVLMMHMFVYIHVQGLDTALTEITFLNVGQGDSIYVTAPNGNSILIDGGQDNNLARTELGNIKSFFDSKIDVILGTHPDADHIGGISKIMKRYKTSMYLDPGFPSNTDVYKNLMSDIKSENIPYRILRRGMRIVLDEAHNVSLKVLYPSEEYVLERYTACVEKNNLKKSKRKENCKKYFSVDTNDMSVVLQLEYKENKVLLTGDASVSVENFLVTEYGRDLKSDVLKLGHHGSKTSSGEEFLKSVYPEFAIVSAGFKNRYGHPHKEVLDRVLKFTKARVLRTDTSGEHVTLTLDGTHVSK